MSDVNIEEAAASISSDLFPDAPAEEPETPAVEAAPDTPIEGETTEAPETPETPEVVVRSAPKSWAKETHEIWAKIPPEAQAQIEHREKQMLEGLEQYRQHSERGRSWSQIVDPYTPLLASQGVDPDKAIASLMNAHFRLSTLQGEQKAAYFKQIADTYQVDLRALGAAQESAPEDPRVRALEEKIARLEGGFTQTQQRAFEEAKAKISNDVNAFAEAKDEKGNALHPYFDEVHDDLIVYLKNGASLKEAYDKAVYANQVTRAKEVARLKKEADAELRAKATREAAAAKKASSANVRSRDTTRAPTEPLGKMEDTLTNTFRDIQSRH